jgi:large subunit ribosomal protein L25
MITLPVALRAPKEKPAALRKRGVVPAVVYGPARPPLSIAIDGKVFTKMFKAAGESTIISLSGLATPVGALVKEVLFDPVSGRVMHVDFYAVEQNKSITADIPLRLVGEAPAVKRGGIVNHVLHEVSVSCLPVNLPNRIDVDISGLENIDDQLHVSDIAIPAGVTVETPAGEVVVVIGEPAKEEEMPPAPIDMSAIAVEKKGKAEEEREIAT